MKKKFNLLKDPVLISISLKKMCILFFLVIVTGNLIAKDEISLGSKNVQQQITVNGQVVDGNEAPLPGVTIVITGTTTGTVTDADGNFILNNVPLNTEIHVSFVGMMPQKIIIRDSNPIRITMLEESISLEEVVAVGYGVQRRISITNAISSVNAEEISDRNSTNITQALQGKLPGLTIIDYGGAPGNENLSTRIRGITSLNDNNPLVLIDGVPGSLSRVNPIDIESVSVLKDAASTAIYGSRAAAGVILVTTKAAVDGKLNITYNGYYGIARSNNNPVHMDAVTYMKHQNAAYLNTYGYENYTVEEINNWPENHRKDPENYPQPNTWGDVMFKLAPQHSHTLTLSGGNENITNRFSMRYLDEEGIMPNFGFSLTEFRSKNGFKINNRLSFDTNINVRLSERNAPYNEWESYNRMWQNSQWGVPYYNDGSYGLTVDSYSPLININEMGKASSKSTYLLAVFKANYKIIDPLSISAQYSLQHNYEIWNSFNNKYNFTDKLHPERRAFNTINRMEDYRDKGQEEGLDIQLTYNNSFGKSKISGILGYSEIHYTHSWVEGYRQNFYSNELQALNMGINDATKNATGSNSEWGLRSYFTRINYDYDSKYLLEANARYDGSSRFAKKNRFGFFPSFSMGWRLSGEEFWESFRDTFNELKFRGSWGEVGSQQVGLYSYMPTFSQVNYIFDESLATGYRQVNLASEDISWETTTQLNVGVDGYLFDSQLKFSFDYYIKSTTDILLVVPIPSIMGLAATQQNAGEVENRGFEFMVGGNKKMGDFNLDVNFNTNYNRNKVLNLAGTGPHISAFGNSDYRTITTEGKPINSFYGFETDGFFQTQEEVNSYAKWDGSVGPGDIKYVDQNNDGQLTPEDFVIFGSEIPDWTFSSNMALSWKNLTLDLFWQGVTGSEKLMTGAILEHGIWGGFTHKIYNDYWTPDNRDAKFSRPTKYTMKNAQISDFSMLDGSYLRLKNIRLTYQVPETFCNTLKINNMNIYVSATNLLTFSSLNKFNIDPEMEGRGQESSFPQTSVTTIGMNINF